MQFCTALSSLLLLLSLIPACASDSASQLGKVTFPISCSASVQADFEHGVALLHSFEYERARQAFQDVASRDPECAMAYWGIAMSYYHPLWDDPPGEKDFKAGAEAAALGLRSAKTPREKAYVEAIAAFYDPAHAAYRERQEAFQQGMENLHRAFPDDMEGEIFYALALRSVVPPFDKTYAQQKKAGAILERLLAQQPDHPGLAHYIIHCYDYPVLAERALDAANRYAKIAPDAPHALHMPSHIFVRLGLWDDAISSNLASAAASEKMAMHGSLHAVQEKLHALDYLAYAYLQQGRDQKAAEVLHAAGSMNIPWQRFSAAHAAAAIPARYALERHQWLEAAQIPEPTAAEQAPRETFWTDVAIAIVHWARSVGAARAGKPDLAQPGLAQVTAIQKKLLDQGQGYAADLVEILRLESAGWLASAEGRKDKALTLLRAAADLEDRTEKHPITPGPVLPAQEQLADLLLEVAKPQEALEHYQRVLESSPRRFNSLYGAAKAAESAGDPKAAARYYAALLKVAAEDSKRFEVNQARSFLTARARLSLSPP